MLFILLSLPLPKAACSVLAPEAPLRSWADHTVLPSSASWQAIAPALRRHLRQPNFLCRGPLWAWVRNKKTREQVASGSELGDPARNKGALSLGCWPSCWLPEHGQLRAVCGELYRQERGESEEGEMGFKERKMRGEKKRERKREAKQ